MASVGDEYCDPQDNQIRCLTTLGTGGVGYFYTGCNSHDWNIWSDLPEPSSCATLDRLVSEHRMDRWTPLVLDEEVQAWDGHRN